MNHDETSLQSIPIGSMYGIYANIWGILMVNVAIYSIHGSVMGYGSLSCAVSQGFWIPLLCSVTGFPRPTPLLLPLFPMVRTLENQVSGVSQPKTRLRRFAALRCAYGESGIWPEISGPKTRKIDLIWLGCYMEGWLNELSMMITGLWWSNMVKPPGPLKRKPICRKIMAPKSPRIHSSKEKDFL